jgi:hypothetical protein
MTRTTKPLQKPAPLKSIKPAVQGLRKVHANACALSECFRPKSKGKHTTRGFQRASRALESALEYFATTINRIETATTKPDRNQALSKIKGALNQAEIAFDAITPISTFRVSPRARRAAPLAPPLDRKVARKLLELWKLPKAEQPQAFTAWLKSAGTPKLIAERQNKVKALLDYARAVTKKTTPRPPRAELCAFVFCDCYEKGRLKRPPPNPEIVAVLPNGDLGYRSATPAQHEAFVAWRAHACRHPEGRVTGGKLGHALPIDVVRDAFSPHRRAFPMFVGKVLNCQPHTRNSHLTLNQVHKLKAELDRLKTFQCGDPKIARELPYLRGQMKQLVRAALKFHKPIAM